MPKRCRCCAPRSRNLPSTQGSGPTWCWRCATTGSCRRARATSPRPRSSSGRRSTSPPTIPRSIATSASRSGSKGGPTRRVRTWSGRPRFGPGTRRPSGCSRSSGPTPAGRPSSDDPPRARPARRRHPDRGGLPAHAVRLVPQLGRQRELPRQSRVSWARPRACPLGLHERVLRPLHPADPPHLEPQLGPGRDEPLGLSPGECAAAHGANAVLFYFVARRLLAAAIADGAQAGRRGPDLCAAAAVAALVWGVHPLRVEPVAWITGRADLLCASFVLLTTWVYLRAVETEGPARRGLILVASLTLAAALLSKGAALPFVGALLLLDVYPLRRLRRLGVRPLVREKLPLLLVTLAGAAAVIYAVRQGAVLTQISEHGGLARLAAAAYSFLIAPFRVIWPAALSPLYEMPARINPLEPRFALALAGVVLVTAVLIGLRARWPGGLAAWTFSVLMLAPTSAVVRQGADLSPDRYTYLSGMGFAVLVGGGVLGLIRLVREGALTRSWDGPSRSRASSRSWGSVSPRGATAWSGGSRRPCGAGRSRWTRTAASATASSERVPSAGQGARRGPRRPRGCSAARSPCGRISPTRTTTSGRPSCSRGGMPTRRRRSAAYMERAPWSASGPERLGLVYLLQGRYEPAVPLLRTAFVLKPGTPDLRRYLVQALEGQAQALQAQGRGGEAEMLLAEARASPPCRRSGPGPPIAAPMRLPGRLRLLLPPLVFLITGAVFLPALRGEFLNWDDSVNFVANPHYRGLGWPQIKWMLGATLMGHYIPVTWLSFGLNYALGGMNPWGYHLGNLVLHAANTTLVYLIARRLLAAAQGGGSQDGHTTGSLAVAGAFAALVWGLHPLRVESVAWITERRDVLCGLFFLLAVLAYLKGLDRGGRPRPIWQALSLAGLRSGPPVEGGRHAPARGPAPAGFLSAPAVGRRLETAGSREDPVRGAGRGRGSGGAHRPPPRRRRDLVRIVRRGRPYRHGGLQLPLLSGQIPLAGSALPDVRAARPGRPRELALSPRPAGRRRRDRGPRPRAGPMAGRPRRVDLLGADGAPDQRRRACGQPARQRPLQLPLRPRVRGAGRRGSPRGPASPGAGSRDDDHRLGARGRRGSRRPGAGPRHLDPGPGLAGLGDPLAVGGRDGPGLLPLPREPGLRDHHGRAGPSPARRGRGAPAPRHRAAARQPHPLLQPRDPPVGPDAVRRRGSEPSGPTSSSCRGRETAWDGSACCTCSRAASRMRCRSCSRPGACHPQPPQHRAGRPPPRSRWPLLSWKTTPGRSCCWGGHWSSGGTRATRSSPSGARPPWIPPAVPAHFWLVQAYQGAGRGDLAREQMELLRRIDPQAASELPVR